MALIEQRDFTKTSVREVYGVPPMFLMDFSDSSVLQNTDAQEKLFWRSTVIPKLTKIEKLFTSFLLPDMTDKKNISVKFDISEVRALKEDIASKHTIWLEDVKEGVVTREEMRREFYPNLEDSNAPGMDDHIIPGYYEAVEPTPDAMDTIDEALNQLYPDTVLDDVAKSVKQSSENYKAEMEEEEIARIVREVLKQSDEIASDFESSWVELYRKQGAEVVANIDKLKMYRQDPAEFSGIFNIEKWTKMVE